MEDEWELVCALSNGAVFNDLELPLNPRCLASIRRWMRH